MVSTEAAHVTAVSEGEGEQGKSEVKVPDGRGETRGVGKEASSWCGQIFCRVLNFQK